MPAVAKKVGILGGGQLAQMLAEAAKKLDLPVLACAPKDSPAGLVAPCEPDLQVFLKQVDVVAFENEFIDCALLLENAEPHTRYLPSLEAMKVLQDKANQKALFETLKINSSPYFVYHNEGISHFLAQAGERFPRGFVLKWSMYGYDGKGICLSADANVQTAFIEEGLSKEARVYAEEKVAFEKELAIVAVRSVKGEFAHYPLVLSNQERGICKEVSGPATSLGVSRELELQVAEWAHTLCKHLDLVGTFAIECFQRGKEILVNEVAPRVHNSGHYTQDAAQVSQFENHWRALLGMDLGSTKTETGFVMVNLLGPEGKTSSKSQALPEVSDGVKLHWYGKAEVRPRRKVGHLNAVGDVEEKLKLCRAISEKWEKAFLK